MQMLRIITLWPPCILVVHSPIGESKLQWWLSPSDLNPNFKIFVSARMESDGHEFSSCFIRRYCRHICFPPLLSRHNPCLLHMGNRLEYSVNTSLSQLHVLSSITYHLASPPASTSSCFSNWLCFHSDLLTQVLNHHFLIRFHLPHWLVEFSCFEPTKAFFLLYDLEILEITMFFDLCKSSKLQVCVENYQVCTSELMHMWTVTSLDLISS